MKNLSELIMPLGHIASGVFVITTKSEEEDKINWFVASWVQQASFDPPMVSICVEPHRPGAEEIIHEQHFTINVLDEDAADFYDKHCHDKDKQGVMDEVDTFELGEVGIGLSDAKSIMVCKPKMIIQPGDHFVVVSEVVDSRVLNKKARPQVHIRESGAYY